MVVPYGDPFYYRTGPTSVSPRPPGSRAQPVRSISTATSVFHPSLAPLLPLYRQGHLAAIQACGSPNASRSHFDSQDLMESGVDEDKSVADGWLNRLIGCCPEDAAKKSAFRAVSMTPVIPRSLQGEQDSLAIRDPRHLWPGGRHVGYPGRPLRHGQRF